jgi:hyperosmotically inducible protein
VNMRVLYISLVLAVSFMLAGCGRNNDGRQSANPAGTADKKQSSTDRPANTGTTASDQPENETDRKISQQVRQKVVEDNSLSTTAHNVTIVSENGNVTLRGNVKDQSEKEKIAAAAKQVAGVNKVDNQLQVSGG